MKEKCKYFLRKTDHNDSLINYATLFRKYDSNGNGLIEKGELALILKDIYE